MTVPPQAVTTYPESKRRATEKRHAKQLARFTTQIAADNTPKFSAERNALIAWGLKDPEIRQLTWEREGLFAVHQRRGLQSSTAPIETSEAGNFILQGALSVLLDAISNAQAEAYERIGNVGPPVLSDCLLLLLSPDVLAMITIQAVLRSFGREEETASLVTIFKMIGDSIRDALDYEAVYSGLRAMRLGMHLVALAGSATATRALADSLSLRANALNNFDKRNPNCSQRSWALWTQRQNLARSEPMVSRDKIAIGDLLVGLLLQVAPQFFERIPTAAGYHLRVTENARTEFHSMSLRKWTGPLGRRAMLDQPADWSANSTGPYRATRDPIIKSDIHQHTTALDSAVKDIDLRAINFVQKTRWSINRWLFDVLTDASQRDLRMPGLLAGQKGSPKAKVSKEITLNYQIDEARELIDIGVDHFYFPHNRDFRGRVYPLVVRGPHPQSNDTGKALLMFADGIPLGERGWYWLRIHAANCAGYDKIPLHVRVEWTDANRERIIAAARDPLNQAWWAELDDEGEPVLDSPWQALAVFHELAMAWELPDPTRFVSHLPVQLDGSCNGLQHLSAMIADNDEARKVNLTPCAGRQDYYTDVCNRVVAAVTVDAQRGHKAAVVWSGKITRRTVKSAAMTFAYGVTKRGIADQLVEDELVPAEWHEQTEAANYLAGKLWDARAATMGKSMKVMDWLKETAKRLAKADIAF